MRRRTVPYKIGPYWIERNKDIGHGHSAAVYLAKRWLSKELVALKVLHVYAPEQNAQEKLIREIEIIQRLTHPNIIRVLDVGFNSNNPYYTMNYAPGGNLRDKIPLGTRLSPEAIDVYLQQIASAIQHAHDNGVMHCDLKPQNILIAQDGSLLLADFGIARIVQATQSQSTIGSEGTPIYMAPEQFDGKPRPATDQYALAILVYEWLAGNPPFQGDDMPSLYPLHTFSAPPSILFKNSAVSPQLQAIIFRALEKKPKDRFPTVLDFAHAFHQAVYENAQTFTNQTLTPAFNRASIKPSHLQSPEWYPMQLDNIQKLRESDYCDCFLYAFIEDHEFLKVLLSDMLNRGLRCEKIIRNLVAANDVEGIVDVVEKGAKLLLILSEDSVTRHHDSPQLITDLTLTLGRSLLIICLDTFSLKVALDSSSDPDILILTDFIEWKNNYKYHESLELLLRFVKSRRGLIRYPETKNIIVSSAPIEYRDCIIVFSGSNKDKEIAIKLNEDLLQRNIKSRIVPGTVSLDTSFMEQLVREIMQAEGKVLFLLSQHSVESPWMEDIAKLVLDRETALRRDILVPIIVNNLTRSVEKRWHEHMIQRMAIINLLQWKNSSLYTEGLEQVLKELKVTY